MNQHQLPADGAHSNGAADTSFVDLLIVLAGHKKALLILPLLGAALAVAVSFMLAPVFMASTTLLPPQQNQSGAAAILSQLGGVASVVGGAGAAKNPSDLYVAMLRSRTVADRLIAQFGLEKVYDKGSPELNRAALAADTRITLSKEGLVVIEYEGRDQKTVAPIANGYVAELLKLTRVLALTEASQRRKFFEYQLEQTKDQLAGAEIALKQGLDTRGVISVDADSRAIMEVVGRLRAQITAKEIQISSMSSFVTENNQEYKRARQELSSLRAELGRLENGRPAPAGASGQPAGLENIKLLRDVKYHQMLYELLGKQYEVARLDEAKESATVQVLDAAVEPARKFKPKRAVMVLAGALGGLFLAVLWACLGHLKRSALERPESAARYALLRARLRGR